MWVLTTPKGSYWLPPGQTYTIGRSARQKSSDFFALDGASISRKHLAIELGPPRTQELNHITDLELTDLGSTFGSIIDGKPLKKSSLSAVSSEIDILLGPSTHLKLEWKPVAIACKKDLFRECGHLDIKWSPNIVDETTHFIGESPVDLALALVNEIFVVTLAFVDHLGKCELYKNFDWPNELDFMPRKEYAPDPNRRTLFSDKVIAVTPTEDANKKSVIVAAGGKLKFVPDAKPVDPRVLLEAIVTLTPMNSGDATPDTPSPASMPRQRQRPVQLRDHMLDSLTQTNVASQTQLPSFQSMAQSQTQRHKRPVKAAMLEHLVETKRVKLDVEPQVENAPPAPRVDSEAHTASPPRTLDILRKHTIEREDPRAKRPRNDDNFVDLDEKVAGMAIVECSLHLRGEPKRLQQHQAQFSGKNYKAFRRKGTKHQDITPISNDSPKLQVFDSRGPSKARASSHTAGAPNQVLPRENNASFMASDDEQDEFSFVFTT